MSKTVIYEIPQVTITSWTIEVHAFDITIRETNKKAPCFSYCGEWKTSQLENIPEDIRTRVQVLWEEMGNVNRD